MDLKKGAGMALCDILRYVSLVSRAQAHLGVRDIVLFSGTVVYDSERVVSPDL